MRKLLLGGLLSGVSALSLLAATTPVYINNSPYGPPMLPPQIDATAFVNRSIFDVSSVFGGFIFVVGDTAVFTGSNIDPFEMMNTRFVTNAPGAIMRGSPGFRFEFFSSSNNARLAQTAFENRGSIIADPLLRVMSTNILNRGGLEVTDLGLIRLQGTNVDVSRSTLLAGRSANSPPQFGGGTAGTNHFNAPGVTDLDWGAGIGNRVQPRVPVPMRLDVPGFTNLAAIQGPPADYIQMTAQGTFFTNLFANSGVGAHPFVFTNQIGPDAFQVQVAFVPTNFFDPNFTVDVRFLPGNINGGADVMIAMESRDFDLITGRDVTNGLYFIDHSAFTTNITMTWNGPNPLGLRRTRRPSTYELFRTRPFAFDLGVPANGTFTETTLYNPTMVTNFVTNAYAHYGASFASPALTNINAFGVPVVPPPGRVEIFAENLNMDRARMKAETTLTVKARNLSSNAIAFVDAPLIEYDLTSTAPPLVITNLAPDFVRRLSGVIDMWSGVWQTREIPDPADTNRVVTTDFHVLIFQFFGVQTEVPVIIRDFFLAADQINIVDNVTVGRALRFNTPNLTITGELFAQPAGYSWAPSNVVNLVNFTNLGIVSVNGRATSGVGEGVTPLENYVIAPGGIFIAAGHDIGAANVQIAGSVLATAGGISISADSVSLSGSLGASSDIDISADVVAASNSFITAGALGAPASLIFDVPGSFTDGGIAEPNDWTAHGGIRVLSRPATGDLLGTTVRVPLADFGEALIRWPATDFGPSAGGFANNLALGTLVLNGGTFSLVRFEGPGAIYIDRLEVNTDPVDGIEIAPDMAVYFADSNVDPTILDGLHGGRLRFVPGFAGPLNSTNIVYPSGETYTFNAALIRSTTLDSDGDGIVNALDSTPVIVGDRIDLKIACSRGSATRRTVISWMAPANSTSVIEYKDSLQATTWQALPAVQNTGAAQRLSITEDLPATAAGQRFYRVRTE